ncbi:MAG: Gfo/Idh/MocA family oxidoreductase [Rhodothermales bacterium]|nr:Gfo/Idh/MocA family oxidoreductase [Rhodothermales bacterium]
MITIGVIGCGYWGPNLIRNFKKTAGCQVTVCCDRDESRLQRITHLFPDIPTTADYEEVLASDVDAVVIATPVRTHYPLAKAFLERGKHVFVEKPLTPSSVECQDLIDIADARGLALMVGHTFEYTAAVNKIKQIVQSGEIGEVLYINSTRVNLGLFQKDINVIWDLAPHDISIISYVLGKEPISVNAQGRSHFADGIEDVAMTTLQYQDGPIAFIRNSWIDPNKVRSMIFVGSKKMLEYDDISPNEKVKIYDKGVEKPAYYDDFGAFQFSYRYGDIYIPRIEEYEALGAECAHFVECIQTGATPRSDGHSGMRVTRAIEAACQSLLSGGVSVPIVQPRERVLQSVPS